MIDTIFDEDFNSRVITSDKVSVVDFYADWCGPCKMLHPILLELSNEYKDINFFKVNIDENPELAERFSIASIPNVVIFKNGEIADRSIGFKPKNDMQRFIDNSR